MSRAFFSVVQSHLINIYSCLLCCKNYFDAKIIILCQYCEAVITGLSFARCKRASYVCRNEPLPEKGLFFLEKSLQIIWSESKLALSLHPLSERNSTTRTIFDTISYRQVVRRAYFSRSMSKGNTNRQSNKKL